MSDTTIGRTDTVTRDGWEIRYGQPRLDEATAGAPAAGDYDLDGRVFDGDGWVEYRDQVWFFDGDEAVSPGHHDFTAGAGQ